MSITYTTQINAVRTNTQGGLANAVKEVDWTMIGTDQSQSFSVPNTSVLNDADPTSFTPFEDMTEAQVIEWINASNTDIEAVKTHIANVLSRMIATATLSAQTLPWQQTPSPSA